MNHAQRWTDDQVPFDARETARDAARREGKTLCEWLQDVIVDHAEELGQPQELLSDEQRAEAIALRLSALGDRVVAFGPRPRRPNTHRGQRRHETLDDVDAALSSWSPRGLESRHRTAPAISAQNRLLDRAIDILSLDPPREPLSPQEFPERQGFPERQAYAARHASHPKPAAPPRARAVAPPRPGGFPSPQPDEAYQHLEHKLDSILQAVQTRPAAEMPAPGPDRRLGQAIAEVVRRQRTLNLAEITPVAPRVPLYRRSGAPEQRPAAPAPLPPAAAPRPPVAATSIDHPLAKARPILTHELIALCSEIAVTLRDRRGGSVEPSKTPLSPEAATAPTPPTPAPSLSPAPSLAPAPSSAEPIAHVQKPAIPAVEPAPRSPAPSPIESVALAAIETLQRQVADLSAHLDRTEADRAKLTALDQRLAELAADQVATRGGFEETALKAARNAVDAVMEEGRFESRIETHLAMFDVAARDVKAFRDRQSATDERTMSALDAVRVSLERVAERLVSIEADIASPAPASMPAPNVPPETTPVSAATIPPRSEATAPAADAIPTPYPTQTPIPAPLVAPAPVAERLFAAQKRDATTEKRADGTMHDRDFIAQARRSTAAARKPAPDLRRPLVLPPKPAPHIGFAQQAQSYLSRHRRPIGLGLAATCVIAGVAEMVNLSGIGPSDTMAVASARIAPEPSMKPKETSSVASHAEDMRQGQTANGTSFGTDPLQTASFTKFGARPSANPFLPAIPPLADNGPAAYSQGIAFAEGRGIARDFERAAQAFQRAADFGVVPAQVRLASLYEKGLGVARDREKAKALYTKAAEAGNPHAMHNLAVLLTDGAGHPEYEQAAQWFRKAAQLGLHDSQFNLGVLYAEGIGVPQSLSEAYQWFAIAAAQGDDGAAKKRDLVASRLSPGDLLVAKAIADSFHPRAVDPMATVVPAPPQSGATTASLNRV